MKKTKLLIGLITCITVIFSGFLTSFADESTVSKTQDNITITKKASWTTINEQSTDKTGNKYAKIEFNIDTRNVNSDITNTLSKGGSTDIVLLVDLSKNMSSDKKFKNLKSATTNFINAMLTNSNKNVRISMVTYQNNKASTLSNFTNNKSLLIKNISKFKIKGNNPLHKGIQNAQKLINTSNATNKFFVIMSDGHINSCADAVKLSPQYISNTKVKNPNLKIISIGFNPTNSKDVSFFNNIASLRPDGTKMSYTAAIKSASLYTDLSTVFTNISKEIKSYVIGNYLIDTIPSEFNIVNNTIESNDPKLNATVSPNKKIIKWDWGNNKIEKKIYKTSVIISLDISKVPANLEKINTNGKTIKQNSSSSKSSVLSYGTTNKLFLNSPILLLTQTTEIVPEDIPLASTPTNTQIDDTDNTPSTSDAFSPNLIIILGLCGILIISSSIVIIKKVKNN